MAEPEPLSPSISIHNDDDSFSEGEEVEKTEKKKKSGLGKLMSKIRSVSGRFPQPSSAVTSLPLPSPLGRTTSVSSVSSAAVFSRAHSLPPPRSLSKSTLNLAGDDPSDTISLSRAPIRSASQPDDKRAVISGIRVHLKHGKDLLACDSSGFSDPYCVFKIGKFAKFKTAMQRQTLNPVWAEEFFLPCPEDCNEALIVDVYDWDALTRDDYMGSCSVDLRTLTTERRELTLALENRLPKTVMPTNLGQITFTIARSTDYSKKGNFFQKSASDRLVCVEVIDATNVPSLDNIGLIETYVKVRIGSLKQKTKIAPRSATPAWQQRLEFPLRDNSSVLQLLLCQANASDARDKILGRVELALEDLVNDSTIDCVKEMVGQYKGTLLHFQVTLSDLYKLDTASLADGLLDSPSPDATPADLFEPDTAILRVEVLQARNLRPKDLYGRCDPFVVLDVGNTHLRSFAVTRSLNPEWNKSFRINVTDVFDTLTVAVQDDAKKVSLGQLAISLQKIKNGVPEWHALRTPDLLRRAGGELRLQLTLTASVKTSVLHLIGRQQRKYIDESERFSFALTRLHFHRVVNILTFLATTATQIEGVLLWRHGSVPSTIACILWPIFCLLFQWWHLPALLVVALIVTWIISPYRKPRLTVEEKQFKMFSQLQSEDDDLDDDDDEDDESADEEKTKKSLFARWEEFTQIAASAQARLDDAASFFERVKNLFFWSTPFATMTALVALVAATLVLMIVPLNWIVMAVGMKKLLKIGLRYHGVLPPPSQPSYNEATALLSRLPSDLDLLRQRQLPSAPSRNPSTRSATS